MRARENLRFVLERIENARAKAKFNESVELVAVSKNVTSDKVLELYHLGVKAFGENRVQSMKQKVGELENSDIKWHFIGRLQSNKINQLIDLNPVLIHSCDSLELALELEKRACAKDKRLDILLQINSAKEPSKAGVSPNEALSVYRQIVQTCPRLNLKGVMSIGAHSEDKGLIRESFETTRAIFENAKEFGAHYCSMGMSGDFELAIECGANILRLGTVLFKQ